MWDDDNIDFNNLPKNVDKTVLLKTLIEKYKLTKNDIKNIIIDIEKNINNKVKNCTHKLYKNSYNKILCYYCKLENLCKECYILNEKQETFINKNSQMFSLTEIKCQNCHINISVKFCDICDNIECQC
jgi:hypothetical protein